MTEEHPIIFNTEMVKAILDGRKTQTRRTQGLEKINQEPDRWEYMRTNNDGSVLFWVVADDPEPDIEKRTRLVKCPYGQVGDRLWVRETWRVGKEYDALSPSGLWNHPIVGYKTDVTLPFKYGGGKWRPSIHMPRWASRITLEITEVRVERVQEITAYDVLLEGIGLPIPKGCEIPSPPPEYGSWSEEHRENWIKGQARATYFSRCADAQDHIDAFKDLWDSLNAKRGYGWEINPWVWVVCFKKEEH